jgi:hypothetical protein
MQSDDTQKNYIEVPKEQLKPGVVYKKIFSKPPDLPKFDKSPNILKITPLVD